MSKTINPRSIKAESNFKPDVKIKESVVSGAKKTTIEKNTKGSVSSSVRSTADKTSTIRKVSSSRNSPNEKVVSLKSSSTTNAKRTSKPETRKTGDVKLPGNETRKRSNRENASSTSKTTEKVPIKSRTKTTSNQRNDITTVKVASNEEANITIKESRPEKGDTGSDEIIVKSKILLNLLLFFRKRCSYSLKSFMLKSSFNFCSF